MNMGPPVSASALLSSSSAAGRLDRDDASVQKIDQGLVDHAVILGQDVENGTEGEVHTDVLGNLAVDLAQLRGVL